MQNKGTATFLESSCLEGGEMEMESYLVTPLAGVYFLCGVMASQILVSVKIPPL